MGELNLCYGCMESKTNSGKCPQCGYDDEKAASISNALTAGTMLRDRYMVGKVLEHNGEGMTYLAYDKTIGCKVLIREYLPVQLCNRVENSALVNVNSKHLAQYKSLMAEYTELNKALARQRSLVHLNPALDLFAENNTTYAVYEYLEGRSLLAYLKENAGELSWKEVSQLFPPLFTTLGILHNAGVLHRGISPDTIFVTDKGDLKLNGFCISAVRTNDSELNDELFEGYAAPEQYFANRQQGTWTDVYGICAVLYRILTGCRATDANSRQAHDNLIPPHELNSRVPQHVSTAIMKGLALDSNARVRTITDLVTLLFETGETTANAAATPVQQHMNATTTFRTIPAGNAQQSVVKKAGSGQKSTKSSQHPSGKSSSGKSGGKKQPEPQPIPKPLPKWRETLEDLRAPLVIAVLVLLIIVLLIVALNQMNPNKPIADSTPATTTTPQIVLQTEESSTPFISDAYVPSLVGMNFQIKKDQMVGWLDLEPIYEFNDVYIKDTIFEQEFPENTSFKSGSTVMKVKVSLGSAIKELPDFKGLNRQSYLGKLKDMGFVEAVEDTNAPNQKTTKPVQTTSTVTTPATDKPVQKVLYRSKVDYNYTNGYVCAVEPEVGTAIDLTQSYTIIVYYAENPEQIVKVTTKSKTTTTGTAGTDHATTKTTAVGTKPPNAGNGETGTKAPAEQPPVTQAPPPPVTQAPPHEQPHEEKPE